MASVYRVMRFPHTPDWILRTAHLLVACLVSSAAGAAVVTPACAQATAPLAPLLDALSITVRLDSATVARGTLRLRQVRTGAEVELVASGIVVRKGLRVTAELRTDTAFQLRRYVSESRDSANHVVDRIQVRSAGGRVTLERLTASRRSVREFLAQRDLMILDSLAIVPFMALAGLGVRGTPVPFLDVRRGSIDPARLAQGAASVLPVADVAVTAIPVRVSGLPGALEWWRDARGHLLRVTWSSGAQVLRDDPPT